jgi:hypothetical protein
MSKNTAILIIANLLIFCIGVGGVLYKNEHQPKVERIVEVQPPSPDGGMSPIQSPPQLPQIKNNITKAQPSYLNYEATVAQLKLWNQEAPELTEVVNYGKTSRGKDIYYIRLFNKRLASDKPVVLITACIHGNEPLSSSTTMWYIGTMLDKYGKDETVTQLLDGRDIYFVPVLSPDSYPNSRHVDGVDPNRDFPGPSRPNHQSKAPVKAIQDLYNKIKPKAVMSGHTWGRVYLTPHGDTMTKCPNHDAIIAVTDKMKALSGYRCMRACEMYQGNGGLNNPPIRGMYSSEYNVPIHGSEVDWYYRGGAFAIVCEYGTHQRIPSDEDIRTEFNKTFPAFQVFVREAPLVLIQPR